MLVVGGIISLIIIIIVHYLFVNVIREILCKG